MQLTVQDAPGVYDTRRKLTRTDCDLLEQRGELPDRYELLDGEIINKMGQNQPHAVAIALLLEWLMAIFGYRFVLCQQSIDVALEDVPTYRPEPDVSVLNKPVTEFRTQAPGPGDMYLLVEVAATSLTRDLNVKAPLYARAGIPEYWVIDIQGRIAHVHRDPVNGLYRDVRTLAETEMLEAVAAPGRVTPVGAFLPPLNG